MWTSCLDEKMGHLTGLMGALEQRLEEGLDRLGATVRSGHLHLDEESVLPPGPQRLASEFSAFSGREDDSSASTSAHMGESPGSNTGQLAVINTMCRAVEALQDQNRIQRGELKALQGEQEEQRSVTRDLASELDNLKEDLLMLGRDIQLLCERQHQETAICDIEVMRSQIIQNCGDIAALRSQTLARKEVLASGAEVPNESATLLNGEMLEVQIEALKAQIAAMGVQQGMMQMQSGRTAAMQQKVMNDVGVTKGQLILSIAALQHEVLRQGGQLGALMEADNRKGADGHLDSPCSNISTFADSAELVVQADNKKGADGHSHSPCSNISTLEDSAELALQVGSIVVVLEDFASNSKGSVLLREGWQGEVARLDEDGDALISFPDRNLKEWVVKCNFAKLRVLPVEDSEVTEAGEDDETTEVTEASSCRRGSRTTEVSDLGHAEVCSCKLF